jgi:hypothetical protein
MKAYLGVTAGLFGLLTAVHIWRAIVEPSARDPFFFLITIISALLCAWGVRLWQSGRYRIV